MMICRLVRPATLVACAVLAVVGTPTMTAQSHDKAEVDAVEMDAEKLKKRLDSGEDVFMVDVRRQDELESEGMIKGAVHIPMDELDARMSEIPKDKPVTIYCHAGGRASRAAAKLRKAGYSQPIEYGGISAWKEEGYPVVQPDENSRK